MSDFIAQLERSIAYQFSDRALAELALTHRSATRQNNERLEFLGDAILGFTIADELFRRHPDAPEGDLSRLRSRLVNQQTLADIAGKLNLGGILVLGPGELKSGGRQRVSILADCVEAVIGAVYLDGGLDLCRKLVIMLYSDLLAAHEHQEIRKDPKTRLQEMLQARGHSVPSYEVVSIDGEAHQQIFVVSCQTAMLKQSTQGQGSNRRLAEQQAAQKALQLLGL